VAEVLRKASKAVGQVVRRFQPDQVAEEGGVRVLSLGMFLRERLDKIKLEGNGDRITALRERHNEIVLPWLDTGEGIGDHFKRNDYMNDLLEYHAELCSHIEYLRLREFNQIQDGIRAERLALKIKGVRKEEELPQLLVLSKDLEDIAVDHELERHRERIERYLGWGGDTLLGLSLDDPDDNKNIILRTPVILDQGKVKKVYQSRKGDGDGDVHTIPQ
jgi:hypothetical protein